MERERKNKDWPILKKKTPGTLHLRGDIRTGLKFKQKIQCSVEVLGRFAGDFEIVDQGKGKFKVSKSIVKDAVKKAEEAMIRKPKDGRLVRKVVKEKDRPGFNQQGIKVNPSENVTGDEEYTVKHKGGGRFAVLSPSGRQMNTNLLKKKEAKALKKTLES